MSGFRALAAAFLSLLCLVLTGSLAPASEALARGNESGRGRGRGRGGRRREPSPPAPRPAPPKPIDPPPAAPAPISPATWTGGVESVFRKHCTGCHAGPDAPQGVEFDTYEKAALNAVRAMPLVRSGDMPPAGPLPESDIAKLESWVDGGRPR